MFQVDGDEKIFQSSTCDSNVLKFGQDFTVEVGHIVTAKEFSSLLTDIVVQHLQFVF